MKFCPNCEKEYEHGDFCPMCGSGLLERNTEYESLAGNCPHCHAALPENTNFCPNCGTNIFQFIDMKKGSATTNTKAVNTAGQQYLNYIKNIFTDPKSVIEAVIQSKDIKTGLVPTGILLIGSIIYWLCFSGSLDINYSMSSFYGIGFLLAIVFTLLFVSLPTVTSLVASALGKEKRSAMEIFNATSWCMVPVAALLTISGFLGLFSIKLMIFITLVCIGLKLFLSITLIDYIAGTPFTSAKQLWGSFSVAVLLKTIVYFLLFLLCKEIGSRIINVVLNEMLYSMW